LRSAQLDLLEDHMAGMERQPMAENRLRRDVVFLRGLLVAALAQRSQPPGCLPAAPSRMRSNP
jgi:hypothetical protein